MKALTVRQPWAWAIIHGGKDVENRTRNIAGSYRGPLAIHAGLTLDTDAMESELVDDAWWHAYGWGPASSGLFQTGVFVGIVDLVDVHHGDCLAIETYREGHEQRVTTCSPWAEESTHHLVLERPRSLGYLTDPIEAKGRLGLWTPPVDVLARLLELDTQETR